MQERLAGTSRKRRAWLIAGAVLALAGVWMIRRGSSAPAVAAPAPFTVEHDTIKIAEGAATWSYLSFATASLGDPIAPEPVPARVAFDEARSTPVVAPLAGHVESVAVRLGQRVEQGERLIAIRSTALVDVYKDLEQSKAEAAAREKAVARLRSLVQLKAEPEKELLAAEQDLRQSQLARDAAELKLKSLDVAEVGENRYWLTAASAGVVVERAVLAGQEVGPDRADPLLVIADLGEVIVTADVPEDQVAFVHVGQPARVLSPAASDEPIEGKVEYVGEVIDPTRRMVEVRVRVANDDHALRPNAYVQVALQSGGTQRVVVPAEALVNDDDKAFVFVRPADRPETIERRPVTPGSQRAGQAEIVSGLKPGEVFVSKGAILLLNAIDLAQD
jgi:cobalt-zinc-cadmium efflux system membrane fusion protein